MSTKSPLWLYDVTIINSERSEHRASAVNGIEAVRRVLAEITPEAPFTVICKPAGGGK